MVRHIAPREPSRLRMNVRQKMNGGTLLRELPPACAAAVWFDPQYRGIMEKQQYGNEGARQKARAALPQMTDQRIAYFINEIERVLKPSGHLFFWMDKFSVGEAAGGKPPPFFMYASALQTVDLFHWSTLRFGMGRRGRGSSEYLLIKQKPPVRAKGIWSDNGMRDTWAEMSDRSIHVHAKPHQLIERLVRATTKRGDLIVDPCAGGYGVLEICKLTGREFVGCDLVTEP